MFGRNANINVECELKAESKFAYKVADSRDKLQFFYSLNCVQFNCSPKRKLGLPTVESLINLIAFISLTRLRDRIFETVNLLEFMFFWLRCFSVILYLYYYVFLLKFVKLIKPG